MLYVYMHIHESNHNGLSNPYPLADLSKLCSALDRVPHKPISQVPQPCYQEQNRFKQMSLLSRCLV